MTGRSRRIFLSDSLRALVWLALGGAFAAAARAQAAADKKAVLPPAGQAPVSENDPVAVAIGYRARAQDIDPKKFPQRSAPGSKAQFCRACVNYTAANAGWGKCVILNGLVSADGWCGSWSARG